MKIVRLITRREKLTAQRIVKLFWGLKLCLILFKKKSAKKLKIVQLIIKRKQISA